MAHTAFIKYSEIPLIMLRSLTTASTSRQSWLRERELGLQSLSRLLLRRERKGAALLVKRDRRVDRVHFSREGVPLRVDVGEGVVARAVAKIAIGSLLKETV